jgi:hypothetical protein
MRKRVVLATGLFGATLALVGCGGDNLELCDGCGPTPTITSTPGTPTPTVTGPTATALTPTPTLTGPTPTATP